MKTTNTQFKNIISKVLSFEQEGKNYFPNDHAYKEAIVMIISKVLKQDSGDKKNHIVVYSDYDADGMLSGIQLHRYLQNLIIFFNGKEAGENIQLKFSDRQNSFGLTQEEFNSYSANEGLVITVDNGSDISFLSEDLKGRLLVLDHHPSKNVYDFVLNPNTGREKGEKEYSTSGGRVVYDFIMNIDSALRQFVPAYNNIFAFKNNKISKKDYISTLKGIGIKSKEDMLRIKELASLFHKNNISENDLQKISSYSKIGNELQMETCKELAAITLISDMAVMDKDNRAFIAEAFRTIENNKLKLPIYTKLEKITSLEFSFNIISQINAMSRMEQDLSVVDSWVAPKNMNEWKKADAFIEKINTEKKAKVNATFMSIIKEKSEKKESPIDFYFKSEAPIGILGLIANKLSASEGNKPTIIAGVKKSGDIVMSARGENVKEILSHLVTKFGGHPMACGGGIEVEKNSSISLEIQTMSKRIDTLIQSPPTDLFSPTSFEVVSEDAVSVSSLVDFSNHFAEEADGILAYKSVLVGVQDYELDSSVVYKSGWVKAVIKDKSNNSYADFFFNGEEVSIDKIKDGEHTLLFSLTAYSGDYSLESVIANSDFTLKTTLLKEAKEELYPTVQEEIKEDNVAEAEKEIQEEKQEEKDSTLARDVSPTVSIYYYRHQESSAAWSMIRPMVSEEHDGLVEEISKELFLSYEKDPKWDTTDFPVYENTNQDVFIATERRQVLLCDRFTPELVAANPDKIFVFGDNLIQKGKGGQAIIRDFENTIGIPTKRLPSRTEDAYFSDLVEEKDATLEPLRELFIQMRKHKKTIVFPSDGIGTGLAELKERSPKILQSISLIISDNFTKSYEKYTIKGLDIPFPKKAAAKDLTQPIQKEQNT